MTNKPVSLEQLIALREARRNDDVARMVKRAIELCADCCESELNDCGALLLSSAKMGDVRSLRQMVEAVHTWQPEAWSLADADVVSLALAVLDYLDAAVLEICLPRAHAA